MSRVMRMLRGDEMKRCKHCGALNTDESSFCHECGAGLVNTNYNYGPVGDLIDRFSNLNIILRVIIVIQLVFIFLLVLGLSGNIFFGMPLEPFTEGDATYRQSQFDNLDDNGDGALTFDEAAEMTPDIPYNKLRILFNRADKNDNGLLIGSEFDGYVHRIEGYHNDLENQKNSQKQTDSSPSSSSNSKSGQSYQDEGHESCPICGSEHLTEFYNPGYGEMDLQCDDCGEIIRSEDDLYINYWEKHGTSK